MPDQSSVTINDYDGQSGVFAMNSAILTAANFDAQMTALEAVVDSLDAITDGVNVSYGTSHRVQVASSTAKAGDPNAQRGNKWQVHAYDNTANLGAGVPNPYFQKPFSYEIPTARLDLRVDNNNTVWVSGGSTNVAAFDPFVTAFEAYAKSPVGGALQVSFIDTVTVSGG